MGFWSWLGLAPDEDNVNAGLAADAGNAAISRDLWNRGIMTDDEFAQSYDHYQKSFDDLLEAGAVEVDPNAGNTAIDPGDYYTFDNGRATEGSTFVGTQVAQSIAEDQKTVKSFLGGLMGGIFGFVPWWLWLILGVTVVGFGFVWIGGPEYFRGSLARRKRA